VETVGGFVKTAGGSAETVGGSVETVGGSAKTVGGSAKTVGGSEETVGGSEETVGCVNWLPFWRDARARGWRESQERHEDGGCDHGGQGREHPHVMI